MSDEQPLEIPIDQLSREALLGVVDDFILREGTDYGAVEVTLEQKRAAILAQLRNGKARLSFDAQSMTCTIVLVAI